jgi:hypothetical protein
LIKLADKTSNLPAISFQPSAVPIEVRSVGVGCRGAGSRCVTVARRQFDDAFQEGGSVSSSPMTSTATPVSAATEQEHYHNDNQDQFHGISPLMATALFAAYLRIQRRLQSIVPAKRATRQPACGVYTQFRSVFDISRAAARELHMIDSGTAMVSVVRQ